MLQNSPMPIELRPALDHDFEYCRRLYFVEMRWIIEELNLERTAQETSFRQQWNSTQVRIIVLDGTDVGWVQTIEEDAELFVRADFCGQPISVQGHRHGGDEAIDSRSHCVQPCDTPECSKNQSRSAALRAPRFPNHP